MRQVIAGLAMIGLLAAQAGAAPAAEEKPLKAGEYSATAKALVCSACAEQIENTLNAAPGIEAVSVSQETSAVRFTVKKGASVKLGTLQAALQAASGKMGMGADYTLMNVKRASVKAKPGRKT